MRKRLNRTTIIALSITLFAAIWWVAIHPYETGEYVAYAAIATIFFLAMMLFAAVGIGLAILLKRMLGIYRRA